MAKFTVDDSVANKVIEGKLRIARHGVPIATRPAAEFLRDRLKAAVPVRSGNMRDAIDVVHEVIADKDRYFVRVGAYKFRRFFYAILFIPLFRSVMRQNSRQALRIVESRFTAWWNSHQ